MAREDPAPGRRRPDAPAVTLLASGRMGAPLHQIAARPQGLGPVERPDPLAEPDGPDGPDRSVRRRRLVAGVGAALVLGTAVLAVPSLTGGAPKTGPVVNDTAEPFPGDNPGIAFTPTSAATPPGTPPYDDLPGRLALTPPHVLDPTGRVGAALPATGRTVPDEPTARAAAVLLAGRYCQDPAQVYYEIYETSAGAEFGTVVVFMRGGPNDAGIAFTLIWQDDHFDWSANPTRLYDCDRTQDTISRPLFAPGVPLP